MKKLSEIKILNNPRFWLVIITIIGVLARIVNLSTDPRGLHQDEAFSAYNSWAVLNYGIDSVGDVRPVYYTAWGSGMSILYSYFTMPLFKLLGVSVWTIRLPQAIMGALCIPVMYGLCKELFESEWNALVCAALLCINPWHIQQSRVAIDACLAVPIFLIAMYFWARYLNGKRKSIFPAAFFFGLTLYSYALMWIIVPSVIVITFLFYSRRFSFDPKLFIAAIILFVMALPLMLFVLVNRGIIPEINGKLFTIPKLMSARINEFDFHTWVIKERFLSFVDMLFITGHDERWWISNAKVGSFYYISVPFIVIGLVYHLVWFVKTLIKKEKLPLHFLFAIWFGVSFILGSLLELVKYHKVNYIMIPMVFYTALGIFFIYKILKEKVWVSYAFVLIYAVCFLIFIYDHVFFTIDYSKYGDNWDSRINYSGYEKALDKAKEVTDGKIYVSSLSFANVMLYEEIPPKEYVETVKYDNVNLQFLNAVSFGRYVFNQIPKDDEDAAIVCPYTEEEKLVRAGYTVIHSDVGYITAYKNK